MKHKKPSIHKQPWTPFQEVEIPTDATYIGDAEAPAHMFVNSRYHVAMWLDQCPQMGKFVHLSIKDHDRSARHDWRDLQRIKNELCGDEFTGVEVYPAESRLVDTCNQYHLYVFATWRPSFGFRCRLIADGQSAFAAKAEQRPFEHRPADCLNGAELNDVAINAHRAAADRQRAAAVSDQLVQCRDCGATHKRIDGCPNDCHDESYG